MAAALVAQRIDEAGRKRLDSCIDNMKKAVEKDDVNGVVDADYDLHRCILALSGHSRLQTHYRLHRTPNAALSPTDFQIRLRPPLDTGIFIATL